MVLPSYLAHKFKFITFKFSELVVIMPELADNQQGRWFAFKR